MWSIDGGIQNVVNMHTLLTGTLTRTKRRRAGGQPGKAEGGTFCNVLRCQ